MVHAKTLTLDDYVDAANVDALIALARAEDLGEAGVDVTSEATMPLDRTARAAMVARVPGTLAGVALLPRIAHAYGADLDVTIDVADGGRVEAGTRIAHYRGPLRALLAMERVALNFVTHLSGVATLTAAYVARTHGTAARICDTRKTIPGLRGLQKYAVVCGGGVSHRMGLNDAMLIKDNHIAGITGDELGPAIHAAIARARAAHPGLAFAEVEVDTLEQLRHVLGRGADMILLDNMSLDDLARAVAMRNDAGSGERLEASGGVSLDAVAAIARTGVDRIAVGALTHSAPALDVGLDIT
ncbi:MAG: carboxylating nicotinate-nucleotide diphosphorylase [Phycisphaeraceae bacterium]